MDVKKYYDDVRKNVEKLTVDHPEGWLYVTSLETSDAIPQMCQVSLKKAAELIVSRSHRESTPEEIKAWEEIQEKRSVAIRKDQAMRDRRVLVMADPEITAKVRELTAVVQSQEPEEDQQKSKRSTKASA